MARARKPNNVKSINGTDQPCRLNETVEFDLVGEVPTAPDWLPNAHAIKEWNRLGPILHAAGLLTNAGLSAFGHLCALHGKIVQLYAAGESPNSALVNQYRGLINDFGLTPVAQTKVKGGGNSQPKNKFAGHGKAKK